MSYRGRSNNNNNNNNNGGGFTSGFSTMRPRSSSFGAMIGNSIKSKGVTPFSPSPSYSKSKLFDTDSASFGAKRKSEKRSLPSRKRKTLGRQALDVDAIVHGVEGGGQGFPSQAGAGLNIIQTTPSVSKKPAKSKALGTRSFTMTNDDSIVDDADDLRKSSYSPNSIVRVYTYDVEPSLVGMIKTLGNGATVVGCYAWFKNKPMLNALIENASRTLFVVNDEDFIVRDVDRDKSKAKTLSLYDKLPRFTEPLHSAFGHYPSCPLANMDKNPTNGNKYKKCHYEPVRALGCAAFGSQPGMAPLMHNKFMIFFKKEGGPNGDKDVPFAVVTGSFNATHNATRNLENIVYIQDPISSKKLFDYFAKIFEASKPLTR